jgi:hypothetical protein
MTANGENQESVMKELRLTLVSLSALAFLLAACNARPAAQATAAAAAPAASTKSPCDRQLITAADLDGILDGPITGSHDIPGDPQSCSWSAGGFPAVTASLRPTNGRITVETWTTGKMPLAAEALAGVGDHAAWVPSLSEVDAEKDDVLCVVQAAAPSAHYRTAPADLRQRLGALCNKIFAANAR